MDPGTLNFNAPNRTTIYSIKLSEVSDEMEVDLDKILNVYSYEGEAYGLLETDTGAGELW